MDKDDVVVIAFFALIIGIIIAVYFFIISGHLIYGILFGIFTFFEGLGALAGLDYHLEQRRKKVDVKEKYKELDPRGAVIGPLFIGGIVLFTVNGMIISLILGPYDDFPFWLLLLILLLYPLAFSALYMGYNEYRFQKEHGVK
jgi:hypothetical protein